MDYAVIYDTIELMTEIFEPDIKNLNCYYYVVMSMTILSVFWFVSLLDVLSGKGHRTIGVHVGNIIFFNFSDRSKCYDYSIYHPRPQNIVEY